MLTVPAPRFIIMACDEWWTHVLMQLLARDLHVSGEWQT